MDATLILPIARDTKAAVVFRGEVTQKAIDKLIQFLELQKDTFPLQPAQAGAEDSEGKI